jgi:hypothetical protein
VSLRAVLATQQTVKMLSAHTDHVGVFGILSAAAVLVSLPDLWTVLLVASGTIAYLVFVRKVINKPYLLARSCVRSVAPPAHP